HAGGHDSRSSLSPGFVLDDADIRIVNAILAGQFHQNALLGSGSQVSGKVLVEQPLSKADEVEINVPPVLFQVGIHARKRAFHDRTSSWVVSRNHTWFAATPPDCASPCVWPH